MDVSELRKGIIRALDQARKDASVRRSTRDLAATEFEAFLANVAGPVLKQAQDVLRAEKHAFTYQSPTGSARLVSDNVPGDFIEFALDVTGLDPQVMGRTSLSRGRRTVVDEHPLVPAKPIAALTDDDVAKFLLAEIPKLVTR